MQMNVHMDRDTSRKTDTQTYRQTGEQTDKQMGNVSEGQVQTQTKQQSDKSLGEWIDGELSEECGNNGSTDGCERGQINTTNERRMEFNDRMQWHTNTLTDKQGPILDTQVHQKCNYPIILSAMIVGPKNAVDIL